MSVDYDLVCYTHREKVSICSDGLSGPLLQCDRSLAAFAITHRNCDIGIPGGTMIINVNKTNRIVSSRYEWTHEVLRKTKRDGEDQWRPMGHYMDFESAVNGMVALKVRMIPDSVTTIREIQAYLVEIQGMAKRACEIFQITP